MPAKQEMIETFIAVQQLLIPPAALLRPSIVASVLARAARVGFDRALK